MSHIHFKLVLTFKIEPKQGNVENVNRLKKKCEPACKMLNHSKKCWKNVGNVENVGSKIQLFFNIWLEPRWPLNTASVQLSELRPVWDKILKFPVGNNFARNDGKKLHDNQDNDQRKVITNDKTGQKYTIKGSIYWLPLSRLDSGQ